MENVSETENETSVDPQKTDEELDSLLDSALDDFNEKPKPTETKQDGDGSSKADEAELMWSEMIKQALQVDPNIRDMFQQDSVEGSNFAQDFSKIAEAAAKAIDGDSPSSFADIMSETLKNLNQSSDTIQNQFGSPEELANLFQELGLNGGAGARPDGSLEDIPPFMQSIMQSFLSKDILYPSIKDFVDRYPAWLEEHKDSLSTEEYDNYCKQLELMRKVVEEFEAETESDSEEVKRERFQRIMGYMQQMQSLGHPPADLIGSEGLDEAALPSLQPGTDPNQCCTM